ncbi:MAG TPA: FHA domain-containing protein [Ktedonobacteraceae bacterium]|nr:FHA domain-containing protein [Ktedonobacteraceae bacterium]
MKAALRGPLGRTVLEAAVLTIGSSPDNQLVVHDAKVSAHHAEIRPEGQGFSITDLGSTHGTYVSGQRLDWNTPHLLTPGSTIALGDTTFTYEENSAVDVSSDTMPGASVPPVSQSLPPMPTQGGNPPYASPQTYMQPGYGQPPFIQPPPGYAGTYSPYAEPFPGYPLPARRASRRWLWIAIAIVLVVGLAGGAAIVYYTRATPEKTLDAYCNALQGQDYRSAYALLSSSLQSTESESEFAGAQRAIGRVTTCTHDSANVTSNEATANLTQISSGQTYTGIISLVQENNSWKISMLLSSPQLTLTIFCNALRAGDVQTAYNEYSSALKGANPEAQFAKTFQAVACTFGAISASGSTGTASIVFINSSGPSSPYIVALIQDPASNGDWKIDGIQAG